MQRISLEEGLCEGETIFFLVFFFGRKQFFFVVFGVNENVGAWINWLHVKYLVDWKLLTGNLILKPR